MFDLSEAVQWKCANQPEFFSHMRYSCFNSEKGYFIGFIVNVYILNTILCILMYFRA